MLSLRRAYGIQRCSSRGDSCTLVVFLRPSGIDRQPPTAFLVGCTNTMLVTTSALPLLPPLFPPSLTLEILYLERKDGVVAKALTRAQVTWVKILFCHRLPV